MLPSGNFRTTMLAYCRFVCFICLSGLHGFLFANAHVSSIGAGKRCLAIPKTTVSHAFPVFPRISVVGADMICVLCSMIYHPNSYEISKIQLPNICNNIQMSRPQITIQHEANYTYRPSLVITSPHYFSLSSLLSISSLCNRALPPTRLLILSLS